MEVSTGIADLGVRFGIRSPNGVVATLKSIARKRWIDGSGGTTRSVKFLRTPRGEKFVGFTY